LLVAFKVTLKVRPFKPGYLKERIGKSQGLLIRLLCTYAWITIPAKGSEVSIEREIGLKLRKVTGHKVQNFGTE
jgi:hypothetical protein